MYFACRSRQVRSSVLLKFMMAEPNPKRAKMDDPNGRSGSTTGPEERKIQPKGELFIPGTQDFEAIRNTQGFVDHTHFIRSFLLKERPKLAVFAPRRFGKSSHLNMVKTFLQIDVDQETGEASSSVNGPAKGRKNYKVFDGTRIITDDNCKELVEDHFGKHPVIHLDFKAAYVDSIVKACMHCRKAVHEAYLEHSYLKTSTKLVPGDEKGNAECQDICRQWCSDKQYEKQKLSDSLENLTKYLYNHFNGAKVYILVDEFDTINTSALREVRGNSLYHTVKTVRKICNGSKDLLGRATEGTNAHVAGVLITGVSYVSGLEYSSLLNDFTVMRFLDGGKIMQTDKDFVPFYGATTEEVGGLIRKLVRNKELMEFEGKEEFLDDANELDADKIMNAVRSRYDTYFDANGTRIFCLWSVLHYLESGKAMNYWNRTDGTDDLHGILKCGYFAGETMKLMGSDGFVKFKRCDKIIKLKDLLTHTENAHETDPDVAFNFLMDHGYLSYHPEGGSRDEKFKLPNAEIRAAFSDRIKDVVKFWEMPTTSCTHLINEISSSFMKNEDLLEKLMLRFYRAMSEMLRPLQRKSLALSEESKLLCAMYKALDDADSFELHVDSPIKDADGIVMTFDKPAFLLLHKVDKKCSILWEIRYEDSFEGKYATSIHALLEARGQEATRLGKTKQYMNSLEKLGREALVIGLSVNSDFKISLSYSVGMEEKIFHMSKTEICYWKTRTKSSIRRVWLLE